MPCCENKNKTWIIILVFILLYVLYCDFDLCNIFGSCSSKRRISFSFRLMQYPAEAIDYVVVHELAHLRHMNHSPQFYALIEQYMPDYKSRRALLK